MIRRAATTVFSFALLCGVSSATPIESAGVDELASAERRLNDGFPAVPTTDVQAMTFGTASGDVVVVSLEGFSVYARYSGDSGQSFGPDTLLEGPSVSARVRAIHGSMAPDGTLYIVLEEEAPTGGPTARVRVSLDAGQTWQPTVPLAPAGSEAEKCRVKYSEIDAGAGGIAAIVLSRSNDQFVVVTTDHGATWTAPDRINQAPGTGNDSGVIVDDTNGDVFVAYDDYDELADTSYVYVKRSTDGGQTFSAPTSLGSISPLDSSNIFPEIQITNDGSVLVTWLVFDFVAGVDRVLAARSVNRGATFSLVIDEELGGPVFSNFFDVFPQVHASTDDPNVFVSWVDAQFALQVRGSANSGASFGDYDVLAFSGVSPDKDFLPTHQISRTSTGRWVAAYIHDVSDATPEPAQVFTRVFESGSWGASDPASAIPDGLPDASSLWLATTGSDDVHVVWLDTRLGDGVVADVFANRKPAATGVFAAESRVDEDHGTMNPGAPDASGATRVYTDGANHVYVLMVIEADGSGRNLWVRRSTDGGATWEDPVRVNALPGADSPIDMANRRGVPALAAAPDGHVYAIWTSRTGGSGHVYLNRSADFGATWAPQDVDLATLTSSQWNIAEDPDIAVSSGGRVYVTWATGGDAFLARSTDGGVNFSTSEISSIATSSSFVCADGDDVVIVYAKDGDIAGLYSADSAVTFGPETVLESGIGTSNGAPLPGSLDCAGSGRAAIAWRSRDPVTRASSVFTTRLVGGSWILPEVQAMAIAASSELAFVDDVGSLVIAARGQAGSEPIGIWTVHSNDAGATYGAATRLDSGDGDRLPARLLATDRNGSAWIVWTEFLGARTAGSTVVARSIDSGATFGPARRMHRDAPPGFLYNFWADAAALDGVGLFVWAGSRQSPLYDPMFNVDDLADPDRDGFLGVLDCDPADDAVYPGAPEICDGKNNDCDDPGWPIGPSNELDSDSDGIRACLDNCPLVANAGQSDVDGDIAGDACDNCVDVANADQADIDADLVGDVCDNCPIDFNSDQIDTNVNSCGDACDPNPAIAAITVRTINKQSQGNFVEAVVSFDAWYSITDIDPASAIELVVAGAAPILDVGRTVVGDELTVRFPRDQVHAAAPLGESVGMAVGGSMTYGCDFLGTDVVRVIEEGQSHSTPESESDPSTIRDDADRGDVASLGVAGDGDLGPTECLVGYQSNYSFGLNTDPAIPLSGTAFFYLFKFCDGGAECDLGLTSAGNARVPGVGGNPCP